MAQPGDVSSAIATLTAAGWVTTEPAPGVRIVTVPVNMTTLLAGEELQRNATHVLNDWFYTPINATGVTVVRNVSTHGPVTYGGVKVVGAAGAHTLTVFDNASAASGQQLASLSVNAAANETDAVRVANGITVNMSGDPTDNLIFVRWK